MSLESALARLASLNHWPLARVNLLDVDFDPRNFSPLFWRRLPYAHQNSEAGLPGQVVFALGQMLLFFLLGTAFILMLNNGGGWKRLGLVVAAGLLIQFGYALAYVLHADYYRRNTAQQSLIFRVVRTTLLLSPFAIALNMMVGCMVWMFIPLRMAGTQFFYDCSCYIGPTAKYGLAFSGSRSGSLGDNFDRLSILATRYRTRFFDITADAARIEMIGIGLCLAVIFSFALINEHFLNLPKIYIFGMDFGAGQLFINLVFSLLGGLYAFTGFNVLISLYTLEYLFEKDALESEPALPAATGNEWKQFVPHALFGVFYFSLFVSGILTFADVIQLFGK